jgi:hypothetical protein
MFMLDRACSLVTEGARERSPVFSGAMSVDVTRLSLLSLVFRLNIALPIAWTLSGRSRMLLVVERVEDFLDSEKDSSGISQDGRRSNDPRDSRDDDPDEVVCWLTCRSEIDACLTLLLRALIRAGEGGPSMAGSRKSAKFSLSEVNGVKCLFAVDVLSW